MAYKIKVGSQWEDRGSKTIREVLSVTDDGARVQLTDGNGYKAMAVKSLLSNYRERTDLKPSEPATEAPKQPDFSNVEQHITAKVNKGMLKTPKATPDAQKPPRPATEGRAAIGRVELLDGRVIAGAKFITEICGKTREETYKVDSPIRWLLKKGGDLLKAKDATIVYGKEITK